MKKFVTILAVIIYKNSLKSIILVLVFSFYSLFRSEVNFFISSFLGSKPRALSATFSSFTSIVPEPSTSNKSKASLIFAFYFSFNSYLNVSFVAFFFYYLICYF